MPFKDPQVASDYWRAYHSEYRPRNKHRIKIAEYLWRAANRERYNAKNRAWALANPEKTRVACAEQRARRASAQGAGVTSEQWKATLADYGRRCAYCGREGKMSMDHVDCIAKGGRHEADNVVPACRSCNSKKHTNSVVVFLAKIAAEGRNILCVGTPTALPGVN